MNDANTLPSLPANVADAGKISFGAGMRLPTTRALPSIPTNVADAGRIRLGAGMRLPAERSAS